MPFAWQTTEEAEENVASLFYFISYLIKFLSLLKKEKKKKKKNKERKKEADTN